MIVTTTAAVQRGERGERNERDNRNETVTTKRRHCKPVRDENLKSKKKCAPPANSSTTCKPKQDRRNKPQHEQLRKNKPGLISRRRPATAGAAEAQADKPEAPKAKPEAKSCED